MTPPRLPGLPTFSALMLSALITVWLGLAEPIDLSRLKEWQTLSAAVVALIAAGIAYLAAMAKVNFDRSVHEGEQRRRNKNVLIRLRYHLEDLPVLIGGRFGFQFTKPVF
jgi:hypothetical protein